MKKKTDDLERLDGATIPFWLKAVITIGTAIITFIIFSLFW